MENGIWQKLIAISATPLQNTTYPIKIDQKKNQKIFGHVVFCIEAREWQKSLSNPIFPTFVVIYTFLKIFTFLTNFTKKLRFTEAVGLTLPYSLLYFAHMPSFFSQKNITSRSIMIFSREKKSASGRNKGWGVKLLWSNPTTSARGAPTKNWTKHMVPPQNSR